MSFEKKKKYSIKRKNKKNWNAHIQMKIAMYKANSQYRTSIAHGEADEYGAQVSRLQIAFNLMEEAKKKLLKQCSSELQGLFNAEHTVKKNTH